MITRSRARQLQVQQMSQETMNNLIDVGLKYEEVQRMRKQNKCFSWTKFILSTVAFAAACFASIRVAQQTSTNMMGTVYDFSERAKESFLTIPYKIPGYSFLFGQDTWAVPAMPWIVLENSLTSTHLFYEPNSTIHFTLKEKQTQYDNLTETIYKVLVEKTNYETLMMNSQHYLYALPQVKDVQTKFIYQKRNTESLKSQLCTVNVFDIRSNCNKIQQNYNSAMNELTELRTLRSFTLDPLQFPNLFFHSSKYLRDFPKLPVNTSDFQTIMFEREAILARASLFDHEHLLEISPLYIYPRIASNSTLLQHTLNTLISPLIQSFSRSLTYLYRQQSTLLGQIEVLQSAYTANMIEKQYETAIKEWDAFVSQCSQNPSPICSIATPLNRIRVVDIVYELRTHQLPIPDGFQLTLQKIFLSPDRFQNATARDLARVIRVEKYKKNPDPYSLLLSGSVGFLFFSGTYYVFFDRLSTILYALTIPFDMMISWGENWIRRRAFETEQFLQTQVPSLPDVSPVLSERTELIVKNTHKA